MRNKKTMKSVYKFCKNFSFTSKTFKVAFYIFVEYLKWHFKFYGK